MKIDQEPNVKTNSPADPSGFKEAAYKVRNLTELSPGDIFKATVTDIKQNQVSIRLFGGGELTAKSLILPEARIGDSALFTVKENNKGQIILEMIKPNGDALKENIAREALISANLYPNGENMKLAKTLMDNDLPIDANSLQKAAFFHYSAASLSMEKIMFFMKENFPMDAVNIDILEKIMENGGFTQKLEEAAEGLSRLDNNSLLQALEKFLPVFEVSSQEFVRELKSVLNAVKKGSKADIQNLMEKVKRHLMLELKDKNSLDKLGEYFKELHKAMTETEKLLALNGEENTSSKSFGDLRLQLEFMDHIGNYKEYMQIPINVNGQLNNAELFVFKEPRKKKNLNERASVLIAIDYANLGRVEAFIDKVDRNLSFQFRLSYPESMRLINAHFNELGLSLTNLGYRISGISFKNIDESFTVLDNIEQPESNTTAKKRYSFDMRV